MIIMLFSILFVVTLFSYRVTAQSQQVNNTPGNNFKHECLESDCSVMKLSCDVTNVFVREHPVLLSIYEKDTDNLLVKINGKGISNYSTSLATKIDWLPEEIQNVSCRRINILLKNYNASEDRTFGCNFTFVDEEADPQLKYWFLTVRKTEENADTTTHATTESPLPYVTISKSLETETKNAGSTEIEKTDVKLTNEDSRQPGSSNTDVAWFVSILVVLVIIGIILVANLQLVHAGIKRQQDRIFLELGKLERQYQDDADNSWNKTSEKAITGICQNDEKLMPGNGNTDVSLERESSPLMLFENELLKQVE